MKTSLPNHKKRISTVNVKKYGIQAYDDDNAYPQRIRNIVSASGRASACVDMYAKFMFGSGFADVAYGETICNSKKHTVNQVLKEVAKDFAHRGFALHVNYNSLGEITEVTHVPFENVRLCVDNENNHTGEVILYDNWVKEKNARINEKDFDTLPLFDPSKAIQQMESEGIDKYNGQVLYYSADGPETYPASTIDPELESVITDAKIKVYNYKGVSSGFMARLALFISDELEPEAEKQLLEDLHNFQGAEADDVIVMAGYDPERVKMQPLNLPNTDKNYELTETRVWERIRKVFNIPPVLIGDLVAGKLGTKDEIMEAVEFYNALCSDERDTIAEQFYKVFRHWHMELNPTTWEIGEFVLFKPKANGTGNA